MGKARKIWANVAEPPTRPMNLVRPIVDMLLTELDDGVWSTDVLYAHGSRWKAVKTSDKSGTTSRQSSISTPYTVHLCQDATSTSYEDSTVLETAGCPY